MIVTLTCQTKDCPSKGKGVQVENPEPTCVCGACGKEITDKVE